MNVEAIGEFENELGQERPESDYPWIVFAIDGTEYAINSKYVLSIEILGEITPVVDAPHYCPGITRSRGEMIDLLDLRSLFGLGNYLSVKPEEGDERYMMVVIEMDGVKRGIIVDEIVSVEYIGQFVDGGAEGKVGSISSQYIRQVAKREKQESPVLVIRQESLNSL